MKGFIFFSLITVKEPGLGFKFQKLIKRMKWDQ